MIAINQEMLNGLGLGELPPDLAGELLRRAYHELELRVGMELADRMSEEQLDEFEEYFDKRDDAGAFGWLERNFPDYREIVHSQFAQLKQELASKRDVLLAAASAQLSLL